MSLSLELLRCLNTEGSAEAWAAIAQHAQAVFSAPINSKNPVRDVMQRERGEIASIDLYLATAGWDLWNEFEAHTPRTSTTLSDWWEAQNGGRAVLILDSLSLRELPWLLSGFRQHGYTVHQDIVTGAELPPNTTPFAKALGFASRSALYNNGAGSNHKLTGARTECLNCPWEDAAAQVGAEPRWVLWHEWPDSQVHELAGQGSGLQELVPEVKKQLTSDGFWALVERLSQGRRLVITGDHGYAATGLFPDVSDAEQTRHLKACFKAKRSVAPPVDGPWVPPTDLSLNSQHGEHSYVLGRRKWKVSGGYPTLTHGGLSVLEVLVPFLEVSRAGN